MIYHMVNKYLYIINVASRLNFNVYKKKEMQGLRKISNLFSANKIEVQKNKCSKILKRYLIHSTQKLPRVMRAGNLAQIRMYILARTLFFKLINYNKDFKVLNIYKILLLNHGWQN